MEVGEEAKWQHTRLMRGTSQNIIPADVSAPKIRYKLSPMFDNCFSRFNLIMLEYNTTYLNGNNV